MSRLGTKNRNHSLVACKESASKFNRRSDWMRVDQTAYNYARLNGWLDECCAHMTAGRVWLSKEQCAAEALKYNHANAFKHGSPGAYRSAHNNGWYDEITKHFVKRYPTGEEARLRFIERAKLIHGDRYDYSNVAAYTNKETKVEIVCPEHGPFMQSPGKHLNAECGCPACGKVQPTDNDTIYIWRAVDQWFNGKPVFKIGITSQRCGRDRIIKVARKWKFEVEVVCLEYVNGRATDVEKILHTLGDNPEFLNTDGWSEFRALDESELAAALTIIRCNRVESAVEC